MCTFHAWCAYTLYMYNMLYSQCAYHKSILYMYKVQATIHEKYTCSVKYVYVLFYIL